MTAATMWSAIALPLLAVALTVAVYAATRWLQLRTQRALLNPVLLSVAAIIVVLRLAGVSYAEYDRGGRWIGALLGPTVVALGLPLALQLDRLRRHARAVLTAILAGCLVGIVSAVLVAALLGGSADVIRSLAPRSVTTPIAIAISAKAGGIPALSAAIVIATGLVGGLLGPELLRALGVRSRTAIGLALGASAHGLGTARAVQEGEAEGATSGLAMGLMGVATALLTPVVLAMLRWLAPGLLGAAAP